MLWHFHSREGTSHLFAKIHLKQSGGVAEAVVPNIKEVDAMVGLMNPQMTIFIKHYLLYKGLLEDFVTRLVVALCCLTLVGEMNTVQWDGEALDLTTTEDAADDARLSLFEEANWFIDTTLFLLVPRRRKTTQHLRHCSYWMRSLWSLPYMLRMTTSALPPKQWQMTQTQRRKMIWTLHPTSMIVTICLTTWLQTR